MNVRDATAKDLPALVEIYTSNVPTRTSAADTEPVSVEDRAARFPDVAEPDGVERDLLVLGLRADDRTKGDA